VSSDYDDMVPRETAVERVLDLREAALETQPVETMPLDAVAGRTLAEDVVARADSPPASHATMDGFAFDATDPYPLTLLGEETYPEDDPPTLAPGEAVRIATGAPLPAEANAVVKQEDATVEDGLLRAVDVDPGTYTYERGSNVREGETLIEAGERLAPRDTLLLGDVGVDSLSVHAPFSVGLLATGTEIHEGRQSDLDSPMLTGLVRAWGHEVTYEGSVPDDYETVRDRIADLAAAHDVVMTTGGTSVGRKDHVVRALAELGDVAFHRVPIRPGKPIAFAHLPDEDAVAVAVPGKPIGAHTVATLVARPFFVGETPLPSVPATFAFDLGLGPTGFEYVIPVTLDGGVATPMGHVESPLSVYEETFDPSVLSSSTRASRADGFVVTEDPLDAGQTVDVVPYDVVER